MRVFVTGASGWIGTALTSELVGAGHEVVGLARSEASADKVRSLGGTPLRGEMGDHASSSRPPATRTPSPTSPSRSTSTSSTRSSTTRCVSSSGSERRCAGPVRRSSRPRARRPASAGRSPPSATGSTPTARPAGGPGPADAVLALSDLGLRSGLVRMPRTVHGEGDRNGLIALARRAGPAAPSGGVRGRRHEPLAGRPRHRRGAALPTRPRAGPGGGPVLHAVGEGEAWRCATWPRSCPGGPACRPAGRSTPPSSASSARSRGRPTGVERADPLVLVWTPMGPTCSRTSRRGTTPAEAIRPGPASLRDMGRVVVTGGAGFVGAAVLAAVTAAGHDVRVVDSLRPDVTGRRHRGPRNACGTSGSRWSSSTCATRAPLSPPPSTGPTPSSTWPPRSASASTSPTSTTTSGATTSAPPSSCGPRPTPGCARVVQASSMVVYGGRPLHVRAARRRPARGAPTGGSRRGALRAACP